MKIQAQQPRTPFKPHATALKGGILRQVGTMRAVTLGNSRNHADLAIGMKKAAGEVPEKIFSNVTKISLQPQTNYQIS